MTNYSGQCVCGAVTFTCAGDPFFTQYCHCNKCREVMADSALAADKMGYAWTAGYLTEKLTIHTGANQLEELIRNNAKLFRCQSCRGLIYGISLDPEKQAGIGVNANNFQFENGMPASFKPARHIWYVNRIIDFNDELPKFTDAPKEQFGTGELWKPE
jgi:hypothetical protein